MLLLIKLSVILILILRASSIEAADFEDHFRDCYPNVSGFDECIREALNAIRPYFKTGLPQYNVDPIDPFFAKEVSVSRGMPNFGFTLTLKNVTESGWVRSKVTKFVSDFNNYRIVYTQSFPDKYLSGWYEFKATILSSNMSNRGKFTLDLYDLVQTTTITRRPGEKIQVSVDVQNISDLKLYVSNLLNGNKMLENILGRIINGTWQPAFLITRGIINDLVSAAFTEGFHKSFYNFPFEKIIKPKPITD
ncbi:hypothetical protein WN51_02288 [Melipona quadrifasciata]|uniref:Circadian clock-controlled protein n=1 Tax=Melipona quadrifasciata TaxID=166423 RepID=A0A0M8ZXR2_9HYME|nr:hypothetical protein WN51_02288 [Melipona quadrifasciata]